MIGGSFGKAPNTISVVSPLRANVGFSSVVIDDVDLIAMTGTRHCTLPTKIFAMYPLVNSFFLTFHFDGVIRRGESVYFARVA